LDFPAKSIQSLKYCGKWLRTREIGWCSRSTINLDAATQSRQLIHQEFSKREGFCQQVGKVWRLDMELGGGICGLGFGLENFYASGNM
jgi:hypothetical protein